jgi:hypothetical protein
VHHRERYVNAKSALEATLRLGVVPVVNENDSVATAELKLGDNDTLSAWTAYLATPTRSSSSPTCTASTTPTRAATPDRAR